MSAQKVVFCFEVPNISQRIESNKFSSNVCVWNVPWEIQVWKVVTETTESLGVELLCLNKSNEDWSYAATVAYRLCSFDDKVQAFEYKFHPKVVKKIDSSISTNSLIEWDDLIDIEKHYVEDDTIKIEFVIEVANPNLLDKSELQFKEIQSHCFTKFELSIKNTNNLMAVQSPNFDIQNEQYFLAVYKYKDHLDVELCQINDKESSSRPMMLVKLISEKGDDKSVVQHSQFHTEKLISWKELRKPENGFNYDDEIKFEVKIMPGAVYQEAKEFIQTILSADNVASTSASTFSFGASPATVTSMAASLTLNKKIPSLARTRTRKFSSNIFGFGGANQQPSLFGQPSSTTITNTGFSGFGTATNTVTGGLFGFPFRAPVSSASTSLSGSVSIGSTTTSSAPVPTFSFNATEKLPSTATAATAPKFTFSTNQLNAVQQNAADISELNFKNTYTDNFIAKFELSINNADILGVRKSKFFKIQDKWYVGQWVVKNIQGHLNIELGTLFSDLRTQPIMLVKLVSNKGDAKSVMQHTRFRTEKLISWKELRNPENGFIYDDLIKIEVTIIKSNIDLKETKKFLPLQSIILSVHRFCIEVPQISNLNKIRSPDVMIHGVSWKVLVYKDTISAKQSLAVCLSCNKEGTLSKYSYAASYSVKLISFSENVTAVRHHLEHHFEPFIFSSYDSSYVNSIIDWNNLFDATKCYVKNDKITFDIEINFDDPKIPAKTALIFNDISNSLKDDQKKYKVTIENVDSLVAVKSPPFEMRNIQWDLQVYRHQDHLGVVLFPYRKESQTMVVELLSSKGEDKSVIHINTNAGGSIQLRTKVTTWSELLKPENGFVNNNSITLEVTISANAEDASDGNKLTSSKTPGETDCPICYENMKEKGASNISCGHLFCTRCITNALQDSSYCPICRKSSKSDDIRRVFLP